MTFAAALEVLARRTEAKIELGLDRVRAHLRSLGDPHLGLKCFHVAGTNGKGSVCAILDSALRQAGYRTGLYTSPHLFSPLERMRLDGQAVSEADFARLMERALSAELGDRLTYFELLTSVAFQWFAERKAQAVVLETGLGGRLDATNVIERPLAALITSISFDHMQFLGDTLGKIAGEKAGIAKRGCPLLCSPLPAEALESVTAAARVARAPLRVVEPAYEAVGVDWERGLQRLRRPEGEVALRLLGARQRLNVSLARAALDAAAAALPVSADAWRRGLAAVRWPGRFEARRLDGRIAVLDGAHNPEAAAQLAETWKLSPWSRGKALWVLGALRDKDVDGVLAALAPSIEDAVCVRPPSPRALEPEALAQALRRAAPKARVSCAASAAAALSAWRARREAPPVAVVCGSFYLVAEAAAALEGRVHAGAR